MDNIFAHSSTPLRVFCAVCVSYCKNPIKIIYFLPYLRRFPSLAAALFFSPVSLSKKINKTNSTGRRCWLSGWCGGGGSMSYNVLLMRRSLDNFRLPSKSPAPGLRGRLSTHRLLIWLQGRNQDHISKVTAYNGAH